MVSRFDKALFVLSSVASSILIVALFKRKTLWYQRESWQSDKAMSFVPQWKTYESTYALFMADVNTQSCLTLQSISAIATYSKFWTTYTESIKSTSSIATYSKNRTTHTFSKLSPDQLSPDHQYERVDHRHVRNGELPIREEHAPGGYLAQHTH